MSLESIWNLRKGCIWPTKVSNAYNIGNSNLEFGTMPELAKISKAYNFVNRHSQDWQHFRHEWKFYAFDIFSKDCQKC